MNIRHLELEQGVYIDTIELKATNPTASSIIFPYTELSVYVDDIYYGELTLAKTLIPAGESVILPADFVVDQEGLAQIQAQEDLFSPSIVKYKGTATIEFLGFQNRLPFEFEKYTDGQNVVIG